MLQYAYMHFKLKLPFSALNKPNVFLQGQKLKPPFSAVDDATSYLLDQFILTKTLHTFQ